MAETPLSSPNFKRVAFVGLALPTAIVLIDRLAWMPHGQFQGGELRLLFFPWLVAKATLLSWCAGRFLGATLYGWIIFFWCQALLDVHTFGASQGMFGYELDSLAHTLISAQVGFLTVWTLLGTAPLPWRVTSFLAAVAAILAQSKILDTNWGIRELPLMQWVAAGIVAIVCVGLHFSGFRIRQIALTPSSSDAAKPETFQFGVKDMLMWMTALAPLLLVVRGLDVSGLRELGVGDISTAATLSLCIAIVMLASIWLALGGGPIAFRLVATAGVVGVTGFVLWQMASSWRALRMNWNWRQDSRLELLVAEMGALWWAWLGLLGALFAAMLLFLRAAGYRLAKPYAAPLSDASNRAPD
jgi:hypothetical protein